MIVQFFYEIIASQALIDKKEEKRLETDFKELHGYSSFDLKERR